jgi:hypothetical protein
MHATTWAGLLLWGVTLPCIVGGASPKLDPATRTVNERGPCVLDVGGAAPWAGGVEIAVGILVVRVVKIPLAPFHAATALLIWRLPARRTLTPA